VFSVFQQHVNKNTGSTIGLPCNELLGCYDPELSIVLLSSLFIEVWDVLLIRVATRPDFSGRSRFPAWMSRVPARSRSGRLCPDFLCKDKGMRERTLYKTHNLLLLYSLQFCKRFFGSSPCSSTSIHTQHSLQRIFLFNCIPKCLDFLSPRFALPSVALCMHAAAIFQPKARLFMCITCSQTVKK